MALLLSAIEMLKYIGQAPCANKIEDALFKTLQNNIKTCDIGGSASCSEFTQVIINNL